MGEKRRVTTTNERYMRAIDRTGKSADHKSTKKRYMRQIDRTGKSVGQKSTKKRYMRANRSNRKASEPQSATRRDTRQTDRTKKSAERKTTGNQHKTNETKRNQTKQNKTTAKKVKRPSEGNPSGAPAGRSVARPEGMPTRSMGGGSVKKKQAYPHSCGPTTPPRRKPIQNTRCRQARTHTRQQRPRWRGAEGVGIPAPQKSKTAAGSDFAWSTQRNHSSVSLFSPPNPPPHTSNSPEKG